MSELLANQQRFAQCVGLLIGQAYRLGYSLTFGDAYRDPRVHGQHGVKTAYGAANSVHKLRLAVDLNLFVDGEWVTDGGHVAWLQLGEFWEGLDSSARWGGRFDDANHFSFEQWGYR